MGEVVSKNHEKEGISMKKRLLGLVMCLVLCTQVFAGCSTKEAATETAKKSEKVVDLKMTIFGSENDEAVYRERLNLAEEKYSNIKVELIYIPSDYSTKIQTMLAGGTAPDIMMFSEDVHVYSATGQLKPLGDMVSSNGLDLEKRFGTAYKTYEYENQLYAMPDRGGSLIVYYNKDLFDAKGLSYPTKDWTWDDMLEAAKAITERNGDEVTTYGFAAGGWWPWWMSFIHQNGGSLIGEDGKVVVGNDEVTEALGFYNDLVYKHKVAPSPEDYANMGDTGPDPLFAQGKVGFITTGFWNIGTLNKVTGVNWDIAPMWKNKERGTVAFGSGLSIANASKHPEEAYKIIEFLTSVEGQMPIVTNKQDAPANKELLMSEDFLKADFANQPINMNTFAESADAIITLPTGPKWNQIMDTCSDKLDQLFLNTKPADEVTKELQEALEEVMNN